MSIRYFALESEDPDDPYVAVLRALDRDTVQILDETGTWVDNPAAAFALRFGELEAPEVSEEHALRLIRRIRGQAA